MALPDFSETNTSFPLTPALPPEGHNSTNVFQKPDNVLSVVVTARIESVRDCVTTVCAWLDKHKYPRPSAPITRRTVFVYTKAADYSVCLLSVPCIDGNAIPARATLTHVWSTDEREDVWGTRPMSREEDAAKLHAAALTKGHNYSGAHYSVQEALLVDRNVGPLSLTIRILTFRGEDRKQHSYLQASVRMCKDAKVEELREYLEKFVEQKLCLPRVLWTSFYSEPLLFYRAIH